MKMNNRQKKNCLYTFVYNSILVIDLAVHTTTTLRVETKVKSQLDNFKNFGKESYSDILQRLVNIARDSDALEENEILQIEKSLEDIKKGRVLSLKAAEKKWGI